MMMETEEESDTSEDTIGEKGTEEKQNIYEEVLNNEPSPCWMVGSPVCKKLSVEKQKLSRTSKSVRGHQHPSNHSFIMRTHTTTDYFLPSAVNKKPLTKKGTLSEKFSNLGYSVFAK